MLTKCREVILGNVHQKSTVYEIIWKTAATRVEKSWGSAVRKPELRIHIWPVNHDRPPQPRPSTEGVWQRWLSKLDTLPGLGEGWDGENAASPNQIACDSARTFLKSLRQENHEPHRVTPSVVGGVGIIFRKAGKKVYVEFRNNGKVHALFSDGVSPPHVEEVIREKAGYQVLIRRMQEYLDE